MEKNIHNEKLERCSKDPLTGYLRDGYCYGGPYDNGKHLVCGEISQDFLDFSKKRNNDLTSVVKPGDHWCLCEERWKEAFDSKEVMAPLVKKSATSNKVQKGVLRRIEDQVRDKSRRRIKKRGGKRKTRKQFLYNPTDPKKSFDVYIDKNPKDTIPIKYTTVADVKDTIKNLEHLYKTDKYSHKRIWQVGMIMKVRLEAMLKHRKTLYPKAKHVKERFELANNYFTFLGKRTKEKSEEARKKMKFHN